MCSRSVGTDILYVGVFNLCGNPQCERTKMVYSYTPYSTVNQVFLTHSHRFWKSMRMCQKNSVNRTVSGINRTASNIYEFVYAQTHIFSFSILSEIGESLSEQGSCN